MECDRATAWNDRRGLQVVQFAIPERDLPSVRSSKVLDRAHLGNLSAARVRVGSVLMAVEVERKEIVDKRIGKV